MKANRAIYGFLAALLGSLTYIALGFFSTPLLIEYLGTERLGAYQAALGLLGYLTLLELGLKYSLSAIFAKGIAQDDSATICRGLAAGQRAYAVMSVIGIFITIGLAIAIPRILRASDAILVELQVGILIGSATLLATCFTPIQTLVEARQRGYLVQLSLLFAAVVGFGLAVGAATAGWGIAGQFAALSVQSNLSLGILAWNELRRHPEEWPALLGGVAVPKETWRRVLSLNWTGLTFNLAGRIALQSDNVIIGIMLGPSAVVPFFTSQRLIQLAANQTLSLGNATWAGFADLFHRGQTETLQRRLVEVTRYSMIIGLAGVVPSTIWAHAFVALWIGEKHYAGNWVTGFAAAVALSQSLVSLWGWVFSGAGKIARLVCWIVVSSCVNLIISVAATFLFGLPGPLIGTTTTFLLITIWWYPRLLKQEFGIKPTALAGAVAGPLVAALVYFTPLAILAGMYPLQLLVSSRIGGLVCLGGLLGAISIGFLVFCWRAVLSFDERVEWVSRIRRMFDAARRK